MGAAGTTRVHFENSQPILRIENMAACVDFYVTKLGFVNADWGSDDFTYVSRDDVGMYLCHADQGRGGAWVWFGVEDSQRLYDEYTANGVTVRMPPANYPWALEFHVEDPEGNVFRFGSEPLNGQTAPAATM